MIHFIVRLHERLPTKKKKKTHEQNVQHLISSKPNVDVRLTFVYDQFCFEFSWAVQYTFSVLLLVIFPRKKLKQWIVSRTFHNRMVPFLNYDYTLVPCAYWHSTVQNPADSQIQRSWTYRYTGIDCGMKVREGKAIFSWKVERPSPTRRDAQISNYMPIIMILSAICERC